jgi:hypothetical protein
MGLFNEVHEEVAGRLGGPLPGGMRVFHVSSRRDSRSHGGHPRDQQKTNRRHMIGDHHGRAAGTATLLLTATDGILGTHTVSRCPILLVMEVIVRHRCSWRPRTMGEAADIHSGGPAAAPGKHL